MARRATSLGPKPSLFSFCFFVFYFCFFCFFFFLCLFLLCFKLKNPIFPPKKGNFCLFICVSLSFSLALFGPPPLSPFSFFVSLYSSLFSSFLPFISVSASCFFFLFVFASCLVQDFILLSFLFLLLVLFCFESSCLISCCLASCFLVVVVFFFLLLSYFAIFENWQPIKKHV